MISSPVNTAIAVRMVFLRGIRWVFLRRRVSRYPQSHAAVKERAGSRPRERRRRWRRRQARRRVRAIPPIWPATELTRNREAAAAMVEAGHEIVSHGYRWIDYQHVPVAEERKHIRLAVQTLTEITGQRPVGWMTGRPSPNTRRLLVEDGGFLYDRDSLADELPYWVEVTGKPHLVIPYSYETNDNRFDGHLGFSTGDDFFAYMKDTFDVLYE